MGKTFSESVARSMDHKVTPLEDAVDLLLSYLLMMLDESCTDVHSEEAGSSSEPRPSDGRSRSASKSARRKRRPPPDFSS
jgi:hypothetical protein